MIFEAGKTYKTRDGRDARVYATDGGGIWPIHGATFDDGKWAMHEWTAEGTHASGDERRASRYDLMPPKRELWINVYPSGGEFNGNCDAFNNKEIATARAYSGCIARICVEYQEGQFDE